MRDSGAETNRTKILLVGTSCAGTDDGGIVSIETSRGEERLRSGGRLLLTL